VSESHRILVVGGGGREHAIAWRLARDPDVHGVWVAPGNDGIARSFPCRPTPENDLPGLLDLIRAERITLVVIGPEAPLAAGLADQLNAAGIPVFGPSAAAARLEASKWAAKELMLERGVPTARAVVCGTRAEALAVLGGFDPPWVIKADGLAAGKGVLVSDERAEVEAFLTGCFDRARFGAAGQRVVIEEFLRGEEASLMVVTDGERFVALPAARDYKRAREGDRGANTGGMGAFAPAPRVTAAVASEIGRTVVRPVLDGMAARGTPYRGALYVGLMLTADGPRVVEFNCRFGDPESQVVLPLVEGDLARLLAGAARGRLDPGAVRAGQRAAVSVALVDEGYPGALRGGGTIEGLDELMAGGEALVFHAGAAFVDGRWRVRGGRALHVAATGETLADARARAYRAVDRLGGAGWRCRRDIAALGDADAARGAAAAAGAGGSTW